MHQKESFKIYNASAGSGKTFTLVKTYLKILLESKQSLAFKSILALTFTNKAVSEMKERIVAMLMEFSSVQSGEKPEGMFGILLTELDMSSEQLQQRSKVLLDNILHNYAAFDVSTIDKFNHKIIRTFAHDLKLPLNFEVELDTITILDRAVDHLIEQAGSNTMLTKVLIDFALEKIDDDKSWDLRFDLSKIAKLLISEQDIPYIDKLEKHSLEDFGILKKAMYQQYEKRCASIQELAKEALALIASSGLEFKDFSRSTLPNHFKKVTEGNLKGLYDNALQTNLANRQSIYTKTLDRNKAATIDGILSQLETCYLDIKQNVSTILFLQNVLKHLTPLSVIYAINNSLNYIKEENELLLISEFNSIIGNEIKAQPTPYIYERIGEKFRHYFIDEFQDTSVLQWENLVPLIDSALSGQNLLGEQGSLMIVGDAKQAIYRFRGGKAEQFIDLYNGQVTPFHIPGHTSNLPTNFRSHKTVVDFNNAFFSHIASVAFTNETHGEIYKTSAQQPFNQAEGYVQIDFIEPEKDERDELYCEQTLRSIESALANGFLYKDICIITRKVNDGRMIAEYLSGKEVPIVSSETLSIQNAPEVQFIASVIALSTQPTNAEIKIDALTYLADHKLEIQDPHVFYADLVHLQPEQMFAALETYGFKFSWKQFLLMPLYEAVEHVVRSFKMNTVSNAYLQFYLDEVLTYSLKNKPSLSGFATYWESKREKLSIVSPQGNNAVEIMTIHKSKGLEFPVVIFPYANQNIRYTKEPKAWFPVESSDFNGFSDLYISLNKDVESFGGQGEDMYNQHISELELDSINVLYVVLTRAVQQLYIISEYEMTKGQEKMNLYSGLFINFLKAQNLWLDSQTTYSFGAVDAPRKELRKTSKTETKIQQQFVSVAKEDHQLHIVTNAGYLWDTEQEVAIEKGNLIHLILSKIESYPDVDEVFDGLISQGVLNATQHVELKPVVLELLKHPQLSAYFQPDVICYNERDILTRSGEIIRPDRIVILESKEAVIIDYKTGKEKPEHQQQLDYYQNVLEEMQFKVVKKILVYINNAIQLKEF